MQGDSRTESDYVQHIRQVIESDPTAIKWHLIMDCLNTHQSESLVRFIAEKEGLNIDLGIKGIHWYPQIDEIGVQLF